MKKVKKKKEILLFSPGTTLKILWTFGLKNKLYVMLSIYSLSVSTFTLHIFCYNTQ